MIKKPELLAPAGSFESLSAAINAGADAVYLGGKLFSARAYATNFDEETLLQAIDYCHLHDVKIYLTINTLLKDQEIKGLYDYLLPLYQRGLDAVIVQDMGVISYIREHFPDLPIHGSTQMNIHHSKGVEFLSNLGIERVVLSRELTLEEIVTIKAQTHAEIECFIHGALCYCYSGQCLMSSILGGRSGNRGRCAQPCRLPYSIYGDDEHLNADKGQYVLSPKDINTLEILPELINAGIDSFKIEGRMKRPEYVAGVTSIYRKYIDHYLMSGKMDTSSLNNDINLLLELFNRGGFSKGYYVGKTKEEMMSIEKPNHWGRHIGEVVEVKKQKIVIRLKEDISVGDQLEIQGLEANKNYYIMEEVGTKGSTIEIPLNANQSTRLPLDVYRTKNTTLLNQLNEIYVNKDSLLKIKGEVLCRKNQPLQITVFYKDYVVSQKGPIIEAAKNQPLSQRKLEEQVRKTGNTAFEFDTLNILMDEDVFIPISILNQIRRDTLNELQELILGEYKRELPRAQIIEEKFSDNNKVLHIVCSFDSIEKAKIVTKIEGISRIYVEATPNEKSKLLELIEICHQQEKSIYLIMPPTFKKRIAEDFDSFLAELMNSSIDGFVIKTYGQYELLKSSGKELVLDYNMHIFNSFAVKEWKHQGAHHFTISPELHYKEMEKLPGQHFDIWAYGYLPLMITEQCAVKAGYGCHHRGEVYHLVDRYNKAFMVKKNCQYCYTTIYNSSPTSLIDQLSIIKEKQIKGIRLHFTFEKSDDILLISRSYVKALKENQQHKLDFKDFNRGHFLRGVE